MKNQRLSSVARRQFLKTSAGVLAGVPVLPLVASAEPMLSPDEGLNVFGPRTGYSPQVSVLVSMMDWMRFVMLRSVKGMMPTELDYLHDPKANTIGAMLLHLAAVDVVYHVSTLEGRELNEAEKKQWGPSLELGKVGRELIKGNNLDYYLNALNETRQKTLSELKKRDDAWLMTVTPKGFGGQPTNNYCKWFHVVEHESNHNGQIKWIKSRMPGAQASKD